MEELVKQNDMEQLIEIFNNPTIKKIGEVLTLCRKYKCNPVDIIRMSKTQFEILDSIIEIILGLRFYILCEEIPKEEIVNLSEEDFKDLMVLLSNENSFEAIKISLELHSLSKNCFN